MSFQDRNSMRFESEMSDQFAEKKDAMKTVRSLLEGQINPTELRSKLKDLEISDEVKRKYIDLRMFRKLDRNRYSELQLRP